MRVKRMIMMKGMKLNDLFMPVSTISNEKVYKNKKNYEMFEHVPVSL